MKKRILFVDDDPNLLSALNRALRKEREGWDISFAESGAKALAMAKERGFDLVVSDMQMPQMSGVELFERLAQQHPNTIRIILSGHSDESMIVRAVANTHQFLSKPTDTQQMVAVIRQALAVRDLVPNQALEQLVTRIGSLPPLPENYRELRSLLQSENASVRDVGAVVAKDPAMASKIMQLANSAFFGVGRHINNPEQAANLLGLNTLSALVLSLELFSMPVPSAFKAAGITLDDLHRRSLLAATLARRMAASIDADDQLADDCYLAALLHDLGRLILIQAYPDEYHSLCSGSSLESDEILNVERIVFGSDHARLAGYLLGLWGFANRIVEAVTYHHDPANCPTADNRALPVVHVAVALLDTHGNCCLKHKTAIDEAYVQSRGLTRHLAGWADAAQHISSGVVDEG